MPDSIVVNQQVVPLHVAPNLKADDVTEIINGVVSHEAKCRLNLAEELGKEEILINAEGILMNNAKAYADQLKLTAVTLESNGAASLAYPAQTSLGELMYWVELSVKGEIIDMWLEQ